MRKLFVTVVTVLVVIVRSIFLPGDPTPTPTEPPQETEPIPTPTETPVPTPEPTVTPTPTPDPWGMTFVYEGDEYSATALTYFRSPLIEGTYAEGSFSVSEDGLLIKQTNGIYADTYGIYSGDNIASADYTGTSYIGIGISNLMNVDALIGIQGVTTADKQIFISPTGSGIILVDGNGKAYLASGQSGVYSRYCFILPKHFSGTVLIPTDRIVDDHVEQTAEPWDFAAFDKLGFHVSASGAEGVIVNKLFLCRDTLAQPELYYDEISTIDNPNYSYTNSQRIAPFWENDIMYNESVCFTECEDGIYGTTLFVPTEILCVVDNYLSKEYVAGVDFVWEEGTNRIKWLEGSSIQYFFAGSLNGKASPDSDALIQDYSNGFDSSGRALLGGVTYSVGNFIYEKQFCVTYRYDPSQMESQGIVFTEYQGDKLPTTEEKLRNGDDLRVLFYGDSIFSGCDASSLYGRAPRMPAMSELIQAELANHTSGTVTVDNLSVGGWSAENGLSALYGETGGRDYSGSLEGYDLLILSFGMNNIGTAPDTLKQVTKEIVDRVREFSPNVEVVLVSCMNPNPESTFYGNQQYFGAEMKALAEADEQTAFVDFFTVHESILNYKSFISTSGNNINHPDDWLIRVYAQNILAAIIE